jgi:PAS domain S-box-containing protein
MTERRETAMKEKNNSRSDAAELRRRAEERLKERQESKRPGREVPGATEGAERLIQELQIHQIELEMQNEELRKSRVEVEALLDQYTDLYDFAPAGYFTLDREGMIRRVNLTGATLLGTERARLINRLFSQYVTEADRPVFNEFLQKVFTKHDALSGKAFCEVALSVKQNRPNDLESFGIRHAGEATRVYVHIEGKVTEDGQECRAVMGDITERKQADEALKQKNKRLDLAQSVAKAGIWDWDIVTGHIEWSSQMFDLFGLDPQSTTASFEAWRSVLHPEDVEIAGQRIDEALKEGTHLNSDYRAILPDGRIRWINAVGDGEYDDQDRPIRMIGICIDITERKLLEEVLIETEHLKSGLFDKMNEVQRVAVIGSWEWDLKTNHVWWSDETYRIFGVTPQDFIPSFEANGKFIHPDDLARYQKSFEHSIQTREPLAYDCRLVANDGQLKHCHAGGMCHYDDSGQPIRFIGTIMDITDRKRTEEELRVSEENFRRSLDESPLGVRIVSKAGETLYANRATLDIFGCDGIEEWQTIPAVKRYTEQSYAEYKVRREKRRLDEDDSPEYEIDIVRKDGAVRNLQVWRKKILWNGKEHYQVIYRDITERKQSEQKLVGTLESLRKAVGTTIRVMVSAVETRDPYTSGHQTRSAGLARAIATEMELPEETIEGIRLACSIHDIGKLSIPAEILSKPIKLSEIEFSFIKEHPRKGYEILKDVESPWPMAEIVLQHHERMDGSGYPRNLKGEEICMEARILALADTVEAMASHRPYRPGLGIDAALNEIEKNRGILYDAAAADACLRLFREKGFQLEGA